MTLAGAYVHIPFCHRRCEYCAFATWTDRHHLMDAYVDAVCRDSAANFASGVWEPVGSVFFGGGTPSLLPPSSLVRILAAIPTVPGAEVTVECNPDTVTAELLDTYLAGGVTRISLGVQSLAPHVLSALGREHDPAAVTRAALLISQRDFASWNVDLIYGAAGESISDWQRSVAGVVEMEAPHVSAYALTVEPGTPLAATPERHPDDDDQAAKYELVDDLLSGAGRSWYEISNWALPGHACRHNQLYWSQGDYLALGSAAHGHRRGHRWWNVHTPDRYIELVSAGGSPVGGEERLDAAASAREALELGIRTKDGVVEDLVPSGVLDDLPDGLVVRSAGRLVLTRPGRLLANEVALRLI